MLDRTCSRHTFVTAHLTYQVSAQWRTKVVGDRPVVHLTRDESLLERQNSTLKPLTACNPAQRFTVIQYCTVLVLDAMACFQLQTLR